MKPNTIANDPAFPVMAMDILSNVLSRADNPGDLGTYLTEEIRDLTGARCVLLIQCLSAATVTTHRIVSVNPLRRREWAESPAVNSMYEVVRRMPAAQFWRGDEPFEVAGLLRREGFELSMAFPLNAGAFRVGAMLLLGLPDEEHISSVLDLLNNLSAIVALVLRNSFLFERQEEIIQERTAELRASEGKYRTLIESANDAVFIHEIGEDGMPGPFIEVNELACRQLGYSREELTRMTPMELDDPRYRDRIALAMERLLKEGHAVFETAQMAKDGRSIPVEVSTRVLELKRKRLLFSIVRDITERKRAEEALRAKTDELDRYFTHALDLLCIADTDGYFRRLNKEWESALGYSITELEGSRFLDYVHPEDLDATLGAITRLGDQEEVLNFVNRYRAKDGSYRWIEWRSFPAGKLIYAVARDITDRRWNENVMSARMRLLQFAATHTMDELLEATLDEVEALTGSLIGFYVFLLADQKTLSLQNWSTRTKRDYCKAGGKGLHYDVSQAGVWVDCVHQRRPVIHNDYASLPHRKGLPPDHASLIRELVVPVFRGENIVAILAVGNKSTDYTSRDVETVSLLADLAWSIVEKKRADEKVLSSLAEKTVLLKEVHHRVKNNLQIICSLLDLQSDSIRDEKSRDIFLDSQNRIRSMALVHEKMYQSESFACINFGEYINNLTRYLFSAVANDPDLITLNVDVGDFSLEIDQAIPCGLIVNELVSNSLKHAFPDDRGGEITVRCHAEEDGLITLTVSDNGVGLPPDLDVGTTDTLGVQLVTMLVKQLKGHIEFERDKGTAFTIHFRRSEFT